MVDEHVARLTGELLAFWEEAFKEMPNYHLDGTLPSIGILDHFLFPLHGKQQLDAGDRRKIVLTAAYIASVAHDGLALFPNQPRVNVRFLKGNKPAIILEAKEKAKSRKVFTQVSVAHAILELIQEPPNPITIFGDFSRTRTPRENILNSFTHGLISGQSPHGIGAWLERVPKQFSEYLSTAGNFAAFNAASFYGRRFPGEVLGSDPKLYQEAVLFPPPGFNEPFPFARMATGACQYLLKERKLSIKDVANLGSNLLLCPDDCMFGLGFILSAAAPTPPFEKRLRYASELVGPNLPIHRPAILLARQALGVPVDWYELLPRGDQDTPRKLFQKDTSLGLHPFLRLSYETCAEPELREVVNALCWSNPKAAAQFIRKLPFQYSSRPEVWAQLIYLELALGNLETVDEELQRFEQIQYEEHSLLRFELLEMKGLLSVARKQTLEAAKYFSDAFGIQLDEPKRLVDVGVNLIYCLLDLERIEDAKIVAKTIASSNDVGLNGILAALSVSQAAGDTATVAQGIKGLVQLAPNDRRVFNMAFNSSLARILKDKPQSIAHEHEDAEIVEDSSDDGSEE